MCWRRVGLLIEEDGYGRSSSGGRVSGREQVVSWFAGEEKHVDLALGSRWWGKLPWHTFVKLEAGSPEGGNEW